LADCGFFSSDAAVGGVQRIGFFGFVHGLEMGFRKLTRRDELGFPLKSIPPISVDTNGRKRAFLVVDFW
jgi:hypothetical protein